jgi:hypothetical protein
VRRRADAIGKRNRHVATAGQEAPRRSTGTRRYRPAEARCKPQQREPFAVGLIRYTGQTQAAEWPRRDVERLRAQIRAI